MTRRILAVVSLGLVLGLAACGSSGGHPSAASPHTSAPPSTPAVAVVYSPVCPKVLPGLDKMAGDMHVDLATGTGSFTVSMANLGVWLGDLDSGGLQRGDWANPTPQTHKLQHDVTHILYAIANFRSDPSGQGIITAMQTVAADCGQK